MTPRVRLFAVFGCSLHMPVPRDGRGPLSLDVPHPGGSSFWCSTHGFPTLFRKTHSVNHPFARGGLFVAAAVGAYPQTPSSRCASQAEPP